MNPEAVPIPQQTPVEERRQVIKTKTIGHAEEASDESFRDKLEAQRRDLKQNQQKHESDEQAEKKRAEILAKVGERRHLQYEVIEDAAVVQVSVINTEDGTVVRKVPPDNVVGFIRKFRSSAIRTSRKLDITV